MSNAIDIFVPLEKRVRIGGAEYVLRPLTYPAGLRLAKALYPIVQGVLELRARRGGGQADDLEIGAMILEKVMKDGEDIIPAIVEESFPALGAGWKELPLPVVASLVEVIWKENDVPGMLKGFFSRMGKGGSAEVTS